MNANTKTTIWTGPRKAALASLVAVQFAVAWYLGTNHLLVNSGASVFPPIAVTVAVPVVLFLLAYNLLPRFRDFVLAQDLRTLTAIQAWRVLGFSMLIAYGFGHLPALFALPAGLGDVAVGLLAVYAVTRLNSDPDYATSSGLVRFHLLGMLDFIVAIGTSGLASGAFPALIAGGVTAGAMDVWPLNLFPSFMVPLFIILQLTALFKIRELRRRASTGYVGRLATA